MEPHTEGSVRRRNIATKWTKTTRTRNIREDVNKRTRIDNDSESSEELYQCEMTTKKEKRKKTTSMRADENWSSESTRFLPIKNNL
jgi:hypothetical protein